MMRCNGFVWVEDIDTGDRFREIIIASEGPSDDPQSRFYQFRDGKLVAMGLFDGHHADWQPTEFYGDGLFHTTTYPEGFRTFKLLGDGRIILDEKPIFSGLTYRLFTKSDLQLFSEPDHDSKKIVISKNRIIFLDATHGREWRRVTTNMGTSGWIRDAGRGGNWWQIRLDPHNELRLNELFESFLAIAD